jgi:hypothetical protein
VGSKFVVRSPVEGAAKCYRKRHLAGSGDALIETWKLGTAGLGFNGAALKPA